MDSCTTNHFGRYEILGELGRGSMGLVYKARDPQIDRLVAIKTISVLNQDDTDAHEYRERFFLEARAAGRLSHPGIVTIYDVGEAPDSHAPYIVMEYVAGNSLQKMLAKSRKLPLNLGLQLALELAEALDYAHSQGVVHRDMKPANILVTEDGHAKIADFGIAKLNLAQLTVNGHVMGTPAYMAPEQLEGEKVDGRADLFSLGVILYAMLTGHRPFQGNSAATVSFKVVNREPVPATAFDAEFPPEVDYVINRAMSKDPEQRYQTGREMALDISELLHGRVPRSKGDPGTAENSTPGVAPQTFLSTLADWTSRGTTSRRLPNNSQAAKAPPRRTYFSGTTVTALVILVTFSIGYLTFRKSARQSDIPADDSTSESVETAAAAPTQATVAADDVASKSHSKPKKQKRTPKPVTKTVVKPVAKPILPRGENAVSDASSKPAATVLPVARVETASSTLSMRVDHHFARATFSLWIDDHLSFTHLLTAAKKKKMMFFKGGPEAVETIALPVAAGKHQVKVRVESDGGDYDQTQLISAEFTQDAETVMRVRCDEHAKTLQVAVE